MGKSNKLVLRAYRDSFNRIISPVHIISHKQIIGVRTLSQYYVSIDSDLMQRMLKRNQVTKMNP